MVLPASLPNRLWTFSHRYANLKLKKSTWIGRLKSLRGNWGSIREVEEGISAENSTLLIKLLETWFEWRESWGTTLSSSVATTSTTFKMQLLWRISVKTAKHHSDWAILLWALKTLLTSTAEIVDTNSPTYLRALCWRWHSSLSWSGTSLDGPKLRHNWTSRRKSLRKESPWEVCRPNQTLPRQHHLSRIQASLQTGPPTSPREKTLIRIDEVTKFGIYFIKNS